MSRFLDIAGTIVMGAWMVGVLCIFHAQQRQIHELQQQVTAIAMTTYDR